MNLFVLADVWNEVINHRSEKLSISVNQHELSRKKEEEETL